MILFWQAIKGCDNVTLVNLPYIRATQLPLILDMIYKNTDSGKVFK